ncbi:MAG: LysR family transcriptional regulator [Ruminococcaceae bacterium]|nr:LysR family transcriptional regulator [Oscillospiraceae bacterium]
MQISYDAYRIFYHVAKFKSFTRAAEALLSNQPNVTRAVKQLEASLGCTLFVRSNRGVQLTDEGQKLYAHISIAFENIQRGEEELALRRSLGSGMVSIGASETALHCLLLPVLRQYKAAHPGVSLKISNHSTPQAIAALKNGLVDLAVVTTPLDAPPPLRALRIKSFHEAAVCGNALSHLAEREISLTELSQYPIVSLGAETKTYEFYSQLFADHGLSLRADIQAATADQVLPMVKHDLGIGFVPDDFIRSEKDQGRLFVLNLKEEIPPRFICMVKRTDTALSPAAKELERMLTEQKSADAD